MEIVKRTLDILEASIKLNKEFSLSDLSTLTGLSIDTVRRYVATLVERGYLYQQERGGNYSLGVEILKFNTVTGTSMILRDRAFPYLKSLCEEIAETVHMAVLDGNEALCIAVIPNKGIMFQVVPDEGSRFPIHATSLGKLLLAYLPDGKIEAMLNSIKFIEYTQNTIKDKYGMKKEIEIIRRNGVSFDDEEYEIGLRSAAAPIRSDTGTVLAGIAFLGISLRISNLKMKQLAPVVKKTSLEISRLLGYAGN